MSIFFQQDIDETTKLGIWKIEEEEAFFLQKVVPQRNVSHPHKKLQHLAGRYLLKYLYPDFPIELIRIADTRKPFLEDEAYHFSISHCSDFAAVIVSKTGRVGIDIEIITPKVERIMNKFLNEEEKKMLDGDHESKGNKQFAIKNQQLTLMWCCKEAVYKWWSYGSVDFSEKIRLTPFQIKTSGSLPACFFSPQKSFDLIIHFKTIDELCLAWLKT
jgi:phosphopantetheinyl transferase